MDVVAIVILNYLNYKDTIECVESLLKDSYKEKEIVVVDNCSKNESFEVLNAKYEQIPNIHIIKSRENLGFARGNNLGIKFAKKNFQCEYVLLANNDTIFTDHNLIEKLMDAYEKDVAVIGPRIISADWKQQNPIPIEVNRENTYKRSIGEVKVFDVHKDMVFYLKLWIKKIHFVSKLINGIKGFTKKYYNQDYCSVNLVLHGSCMMLTKDYFKYYDGLYNKTFLYYEENILTLITQKVGLKKKYVHNAYIYHKEDQSSLMSFNNLNSLKNKYELESVKECLKIFDYDYNNIKNNTK